MTRENVSGGLSCAIKCLPADLIKNRTARITSLADGPRKRMRRNELRNKMLASRSHQKSYCGDHVACQQPEKTYKED
ncbi:hypothetical protein PanWU01x14_288240 [Parasponia andersonii]|uniref:Uncharacterized protein n=1 Tax=Parasponia andersonii TaxID=3476 RepID=A0A2P5AYN9_PARAD|nr:hypothetical protein PanWU01x14_288240 [Parasponia andersonii]